MRFGLLSPFPASKNLSILYFKYVKKAFLWLSVCWPEQICFEYSLFNLWSQLFALIHVLCFLVPHWMQFL